jgi:hypothetical protein
MAAALTAGLAAGGIVAACLPLGDLGGGAGGGAGGGPPAPADTLLPSDGGDAGITGENCAVDPVTRVELCTRVSLCPSVAVDHDRFPFCGLRIRGNTFDLTCWCDGWVCPMGTPTTCNEARRLLDTQFESQVCAQVDEGRCTQPQTEGDPVEGPPEGALRCAPDCIQACGGGTACRFACGCDS